MEMHRYCREDGTDLAYRAAGSGPAILLLHGFTMSSEMWWTNGIVEALSSLPAKTRLIAPDVLGHGGSVKPTDPALYGNELVADIGRLMAAEQISTMHVIGFSLGAELALAHTLVKPDSVASLTLIGSGWSPSEVVPIYAGIGEWLRTPDNAARFPNADALTALAGSVAAWIDLPEPAIAGLRLPVLGIVGSEDPERAYLERMMGVLPGFALNVLPDTPHETSWRHPRLPELIIGFLRRRLHQ
ncbi:MAG: alpha/beta hydrolase [Pseudomonadota bacterium]